jgi:ABC-2 type transport system permease protein
MASLRPSASSFILHPSSFSQVLRLFGAFLKRDLKTEISYRFAFLFNMTGVVFNAFTFYFVSQLIGESVAPYLEQYNGDYFSFVIIGIAFGGYFGLGLSSFSAALRQAQTTGTLEAMMMTPTPVSLVIIGSALWSYAFTTFRVLVYLLLGTLFLGLHLGQANYPAALASLLLAIIAFASIGIISASIIMIIKRGEPITALFNAFAVLIGGIYYPVEILPDWLELPAKLLPITYALRAMRFSLLTGASWSALAPDLLVLAAFCVVLFPLSLVAFRYSVERARLEGSLTHF